MYGRINTIRNLALSALFSLKIRVHTLNHMKNYNPLTHLNKLGVFLIPIFSLTCFSNIYYSIDRAIGLYNQSHQGGIYMKNKKNLYDREGVNQAEKANVPAKRVNVVRLKMVKESSMLYKHRVIRSPEDGYKLIKQF